MEKLLFPLIPKIEALAKSHLRYKIAEGGRGSGKSYGIATVMAARGLIHKDARILCLRETQNSLSDSTLATLKRVIHDHNLDQYFFPTRHGLQSITGTEYIFRGLQHPDRIRSLEDITHCWVAEAHRVTEEAWEILIPTIRADDSEIWIDYNPDSETDPVVTRFAGREDVCRQKINWHDNRFFPKVLEAEKDYDYEHDIDKYNWIWEGQYRRISNSLVFHGKYFIQAFETPPDAQFYFGVDWGFSVDPTTMVRCFVEGRTLFIDYEAWAVKCELDDTPALFDQIPESRIWNSFADSARPETISHIRKRGFKIKPAKKGPGSVEDGIEYIRSFERIMIHPRCPHVIDEFKLYSYIRDRLTDEPTPKLEDKNNHCIDALRYALSVARKAKAGGQGGAGLNVM